MSEDAETGEIESELPCEPEEIEKLKAELAARDKGDMDSFWRDKYEKEAKKNWDLFYKRNANKFFKDRHYLHRELPELVSDPASTDRRMLIEVGCGVGNALFPLLESVPSLYGVGIDFSSKAIDLVKEHKMYDEEKTCRAYVCDITVPPEERILPFQDDLGKFDFAIMLFVLSAISPSKWINAIKLVYDTLKPGGLFFFRDYARYDLAQMRLDPKSKIEDNFYVRQDGTRAYYFLLEQVEELVKEAGFEIVRKAYIRKTIENRKEKLAMKRIWLQVVCKKI